MISNETKSAQSRNVHTFTSKEMNRSKTRNTNPSLISHILIKNGVHRNEPTQH